MNIHSVALNPSKAIDFCTLIANMSDENLEQLSMQNPPDLGLVKHFAVCPKCWNRMNQVLVDSFEKLLPGMGNMVVDLIESTTKELVAEIIKKRNAN